MFIYKCKFLISKQKELQIFQCKSPDIGQCVCVCVFFLVLKSVRKSIFLLLLFTTSYLKKKMCKSHQTYGYPCYYLPTPRESVSQFLGSV